jgi:hypothetical protein
MWELFSNKKKRLYVLENHITHVFDEDVDYKVDDDMQATWLVLKNIFLSRFYIIILHLKYQ